MTKFARRLFGVTGFPGGASGKEPTCQCRRPKRCGFDPWVEKIPWRSAWQPTPVFMPGESHGQRSLVGHSPLSQTRLKQLSTHACIWGGRGLSCLPVELPAECLACAGLQFSLLSEVRGTISPQDLDRFDHLVLRREIESMKARQPPGPAAGDTYSTVSYSDTGSSTGSHGTSTTVSSARVSSPCPMPDLTASKGVKTHLGSNPALGVSAGT